MSHEEDKCVGFGIVPFSILAVFTDLNSFLLYADLLQLDIENMLVC